MGYPVKYFSRQINKRARTHHASHKFLGIHDVAFRKKGVELQIAAKGEKLEVTLTNKIEHSLIIQSARAKYLKIVVHRGEKSIWRNYQKYPEEDRQGYFAASFKKHGKQIIVSVTATSGSFRNLGAKETQILHYTTPPLKSGDEITVGLYMRLAKRSCANAVILDAPSLMKETRIKEINLRY